MNKNSFIASEIRDIGDVIPPVDLDPEKVKKLDGRDIRSRLTMCFSPKETEGPTLLRFLQICRPGMVDRVMERFKDDCNGAQRQVNAAEVDVEPEPKQAPLERDSYAAENGGRLPRVTVQPTDAQRQLQLAKFYDELVAYEWSDLHKYLDDVHQFWMNLEKGKHDPLNRDPNYIINVDRLFLLKTFLECFNEAGRGSIDKKTYETLIRKFALSLTKHFSDPVYKDAIEEFDQRQQKQ